MAFTRSPLRLTSNLSPLESPRAGEVSLRVIPSASGIVARAQQLLAAALASRNDDAVLINCDPFLAHGFCLLSRFIPGYRPKLLYADVNYNLPRTISERMRARIKRWLLQRVDRFLLLQREFGGYTDWYGIEADRVSHVPFKVNSLELLETLEPSEGDYIFSGGVTLRDWGTLAAATRELNLPLVIGIPEDEELRRSGVRTRLPDLSTFGSRTTLVRHTGDPRSWLSIAAGAKFVVLAIDPDSLNPSGVSTYLSCLALGKCLVISRGPATEGLLDEETAVIVPPADPEALRTAISRVSEDEVLRRTLARNGQAYALALGGSDRLHTDLLRSVELAVADHADSAGS